VDRVGREGGWVGRRRKGDEVLHILHVNYKLYIKYY